MNVVFNFSGLRIIVFSPRKESMKNINKLIKLERVRKGWTQKQLAEKFGCNQTYISMIEMEKRGCPNWVIEKCGDIFGESFIKGAGSAKKVYIESINSMLKHLGTDKLITIEQIVKWSYNYGVVRGHQQQGRKIVHIQTRNMTKRGKFFLS